MNKVALTISVLALLVAGSAYIFIKPIHSAVNNLGGAGNTFSQRVFFQDGAIVGGVDYATSSQGTATYSAVPFMNAKVIEQQAPAALTVTLPTGASLSAAGYLQNIGDTDTKFIHASTTKVIFAGNTGITLSAASTTVQVGANTTGRLDCVRLGASEARLIQCILTAD